jgi:hypothetical protein
VGLFSFVGKALKGISKVAGFIPGVGGTISKITGSVGGLLDHKRPMSNPRVSNPMIARGKTWSRSSTPGFFGTRTIRMSPVMPGGAISTTRGMVTQSGGAIPLTFGGSSTAMAPARRKRRKMARASARRRTRRASGRRLKFGSPAWRKKYMKRARR